MNFPFTFSQTPLLGVVEGSSNFVLSAQINALETSNEGKIISSPKVTTLDNVKATIKQGEEIPYVTESTSGGVVTRTVMFKEAVLKLDVKPTITPEGKISMEIKATNDFADYTRSIQGNPPINKNEVDSTVVVHDGDTIVIGGIYKSNDIKGSAAYPVSTRFPCSAGFSRRRKNRGSSVKSSSSSRRGSFRTPRAAERGEGTRLARLKGKIRDPAAATRRGFSFQP